MSVKSLYNDLQLSAENQRCREIMLAFKVGSNEFDLNRKIDPEKLTLESFVEANLAFSLYCELKYFSIDSNIDWKVCALSLKKAYSDPSLETLRKLGSKYNEITRSDTSTGKEILDQLAYYLITESEIV